MLSDRCLSVCNVVFCGQMVEWIRMPLGVEVGLGQGHVGLDLDPAAPTERGTAASLLQFTDAGAPASV